MLRLWEGNGALWNVISLLLRRQTHVSREINFGLILPPKVSRRIVIAWIAVHHKAHAEHGKQNGANRPGWMGIQASESNTIQIVSIGIKNVVALTQIFLNGRCHGVGAQIQYSEQLIFLYRRA